MWLGFPIHKEIEKHRGIVTNFHNTHMPPDEVIIFYNMRSTLGEFIGEIVEQRAI
jgi:hypothetical protein